MKIQFKSKFERKLFYVLLWIALIMIAFYVYIMLISDPKSLLIQIIALLVILACVVMGPGLIVLMFEIFLVVSVIKEGTNWQNVMLLIGICAFVNSVLGVYGAFGILIFLRKRSWFM